MRVATRRESVASERRELGVWYWAGEMRGWAGKALGAESLAGRLDSGASEVEVVGRGLVELEVGDGLWLGGVEGRCLIEEPGEEIALGRSACGREGRGLVRETTGPVVLEPPRPTRSSCPLRSHPDHRRPRQNQPL